MIENYQNFLFPYAYNIVGTADDAKDVVQEVMESYLSIPKVPDEDERKYLIKSVINRAINAKIKSSRLISENSVWLPEPVATSDAADINLHLRDILFIFTIGAPRKIKCKGTSRIYS
ncbi:RNA polymerase sigma factor [Mucilaginibacter agri]|uniref:RNA polymerase sigma-70 region 2 domain-containing protein n=1 Tax=Mucilaginibacter agri TaxID=2695265 RepID=A0A965ZDL8_9SPHI|nr:sigma factor [Mucilaginibacter agri]NCD69109.1 hypothetical protein [Mucilaginibacter agri]